VLLLLVLTLILAVQCLRWRGRTVVDAEGQGAVWRGRVRVVHGGRLDGGGTEAGIGPASNGRSSAAAGQPLIVRCRLHVLVLRLRLGRRELVFRMGFLVVGALDAGPFVELGAQRLGLEWPAVAADLGHELVVVLGAEPLGEILVGLAVQHKGVHGPLDLAGRLGLDVVELAQALVGGPVDKRLNVGDFDVGIVAGGGTERAGEGASLAGGFGAVPFPRRRLLDAVGGSMAEVAAALV